MLEFLRKEVLAANISLARRGLVVSTFGNASCIWRPENRVVIKPSGVPYESLQMHNLVVTDLDGGIVEGDLPPSCDLPTHLAIYNHFSEVGGIVHTHSKHATAWAQARREIPCLGTTHADYFHGAIPVTRLITEAEVLAGYERSTGLAIVERFANIDPMTIPAVLVAGHGPFCWGRSVTEAVEIAYLLETIAEAALLTVTLDHAAKVIPDYLAAKHYSRKHSGDVSVTNVTDREQGRKLV